MTNPDIEERLIRAILAEVIEKGERGLRSKSVALRAGMTESTMFRYFPTIDELLVASIDWAWHQVNVALGKKMFERPLLPAHRRIQAEFEEIWDARDDDHLALVFAGAFGLHHVMAGYESPARDRFIKHLIGLCENYRGREDKVAVGNLRTQLMAIAVMLWKYWRPSGWAEGALTQAAYLGFVYPLVPELPVTT